MEKDIYLDGVITAYRKLIAERYQYDYLVEHYDLPKSFDKERVNRFKDYFLENIYPEPKKRNELNEAFDSLDNYIKHPEKLLRLLVESAKLIFKHGRHLPKILSAGLKAMRSFKAANRFEYQLVDQAKLSEFEPPFSSDQMNELLKQLPKNELDAFVESSRALFETLHDRPLVEKIKDIVEYLIKRMKSQTKHFSETEVSGLILGRNIIVEGDKLFDELTQDEQYKIFEFVVNLEKDVIDKLFI